MLTEDAKALLEEGNALIVGFTQADGAPHATRGYGLDIEPSSNTAQLLMSEPDAVGFGLRPGDTPSVPIAVTAANIRTLASVQVKGVLLAISSATDADHARKDRYCDAFTNAIHEVDGIPLEIAERWRPTTVVRCQITLEEMFVQTPGPGAGQSLGPVAT